MFDENITLIDALTITLICMLTVFIVLYLITMIIGLFKFIQIKQVNKDEIKSEIPTEKSLQIEDIKDEDMMVAAIVATIDYSNDTKKDIRLKSIKQI